MRGNFYSKTMHFLNTLLDFKLGNQKIEIYFSYLMLGMLLSALFYKWPVPSFTLNDVFTYVQMVFDWAKNLHPLVLKLVPGGLLIIATGRYWKRKLESKAAQEKPPIDQRKGYSLLLGVLLFLTFADFLGCNTPIGTTWLIFSLGVVAIIYWQTAIIKEIEKSLTNTEPSKIDALCRANCMVTLGITVLGFAVLLIMKPY